MLINSKSHQMCFMSILHKNTMKRKMPRPAFIKAVVFSAYTDASHVMEVDSDVVNN